MGPKNVFDQAELKRERRNLHSVRVWKKGEDLMEKKLEKMEKNWKKNGKKIGKNGKKMGKKWTKWAV